MAVSYCLLSLGELVTTCLDGQKGVKLPIILTKTFVDLNENKLKYTKWGLFGSCALQFAGARGSSLLQIHKA